MAATQGTDFSQIKVSDRLGAGAQVQSADGTFTAGNLPEYKVSANDGTVGDSGIPVSNVALISKVQQEAYTYAADTGTANAYAVTLSPAPTIVAGSEVVFKVAHANTGASTLAANGGAIITIKKWSSGSLVDLASGDFSAGQMVRVVNDGAYWQWVGGPPGASQLRAAAIVYYLAGKPAASAACYVDVPGNLSTFQIPGNFSGSFGKCGTNPTATATYTFSKNGSSIGSLSISTSGVFTWSTTSGAAVSFTPGSDELSWTAPGTQDSTLSDVRFGIAVTVS